MASRSTPRFTFDEPPTEPKISPTADTLSYLLTLRDILQLVVTRLDPHDPTVQQAQALLTNLDS